MHLINDLPLREEKLGAWELGTENNNHLNFESTMMCTNNVVVMNLCIMDVVVVISLTHKPFHRPTSSPTPAFFLYSGDISVVAASLPSPLQAIHCLMIVCVDILICYSDFYKPAMC